MPTLAAGGRNARRDPGGSPVQGAPELPYLAAHRRPRRHLRGPAGRGRHPTRPALRRPRAAARGGDRRRQQPAREGPRRPRRRAAPRGCLGRAEFHGEEALAGAGVSLSALIREAAALNLGGIECLVGIPATIGGALAMNAGTADGWIGDFVSAVYFLHPDGSLGEFKPAPGT